MKRSTLLACIISLTFLICSCSIQEKRDKSYPTITKPISIIDGKFVDKHNRQLILSGVNLVNKDSSKNYIGPEDSETFKNFKKSGFNIIRLGIIWDGLEPEPGVFDENYLKQIDQQIQWAKENDLLVFMDMHQDLFSVKYSDGAPEWATLDENKEHITGAVWSDSYLISPAVQTSWDNFWANKPVSDGIGVQDHYAKAWQHVAKRYVNNHTVVGFDVMNEPFAGSEALAYSPKLFEAYGELIFQRTEVKKSLEEIAMMWSEPQGRFDALKTIADKESFAQVMDAIYEINTEFESTAMQSFYQKVADAIREVDSNKILFFNHSYFCNSGVRTALQPVTTKDGKSDPLVAYAAHAYDLLVDTKELENSSTERLEHIFGRIHESSQRMNAPVLLGEWGAFGNDSPGISELAYTQIKLIEKLQFSNTYWAYGMGTENNNYYKNVLTRPYPISINGNLISYKYDRDSGTFVCTWKETANISAPTSIYIPNLSLIDMNEIISTNKGIEASIQAIEESTSGYLYIKSSGMNTERTISFPIQKN